MGRGDCRLYSRQLWALPRLYEIDAPICRRQKRCGNALRRTASNSAPSKHADVRVSVILRTHENAGRNRKRIVGNQDYNGDHCSLDKRPILASAPNEGDTFSPRNGLKSRDPGRSLDQAAACAFRFLRHTRRRDNSHIVARVICTTFETALAMAT